MKDEQKPYVIHVSQSRKEFEGKEDLLDVHLRMKDRAQDEMATFGTPELERLSSAPPASRPSVFQRQVSGDIEGEVSGFQRQVSSNRDDLRPRSAPVRRKGNRGTAKNPFIEYDAREKRLNQERKWLQEAVGFMEQRRDELRFGALMNQLNIRSDGEDRLYENRTFYGPHSVAMKARQRARAGKSEVPTVPITPPKEVPRGRRSPKEQSSQLVKRLAQDVCAKILGLDLKTSVSDETQRRFLRECFRNASPEAVRYSLPVDLRLKYGFGREDPT
eukprot:symbB.v1.2.023690.t1/scaffold2188.1/size86315/5